MCIIIVYKLGHIQKFCTVHSKSLLILTALIKTETQEKDQTEAAPTKKCSTHHQVHQLNHIHQKQTI